MGKLDGKVAVITGGASGIGHATVRLFVEEGCRVVIADLQDDKGAALAEELGGKSASYLHVDVSREADVSGAIAHAVTRFGRLDCVFNNAGAGGVTGPIAEIPAEGFDQTMGVLLRGVFLGMKHAAPVMKQQVDKPALFMRIRADEAQLAELKKKLGARLVYEDTIAIPVPDADALAWEITPHLPERIGQNLGGGKRRKRRR